LQFAGSKMKFSLVIACYRQEQYIRETVESALALPRLVNQPDRRIALWLEEHHETCL